MIFFVIGLAVFLLSLFFVWLIGTFAHRYGWIAQPRDDRWHRRPVALYGGVAIFLSFCFGVLFLIIFEPRHYFPQPLLFIFLGSGLMFFLGLIDDKLNIKPSTKLIGQIIAASIPIIAGLVLVVTPWHVVNIIITFLWFIGIVNAINIIDNMDGLAAGVVVISTVIIITLRALGQIDVAHDWLFGVGIIFLYAVAGFWIVNRHPASIFMGDSGSLFIGYFLAGLAMISTQGDTVGASSTLFALLLPATALTVPIFDTILVTITRKLRGKPVSLGGKDHSSHRLVGLGFSEEKSVYVLYGLSIFGGVMAIAIKVWTTYSIPFLIFYVLLLIFIGIYLGKTKIYPVPDSPELKHRWTPIFTEVFYKRHIGEVFLDLILIALGYYFAYYLRFEGLLYEQAHLYVQSLPIVIVACLLGLYLAGAYRGIWHLITLTDVMRYVRGILIGVGISVLLLVILYRFDGYSRAVFVIFGTFLFIFMIGSRLSFRVFDDFIQRRLLSKCGRGILIYGAGNGGRLLYEECLRNPEYVNYNIIGFIDDDKQKRHCSIAGLEIYNPEDIIHPHGAVGLSIQELWISSSKISNERIMELIRELECVTNYKIEMRRFIMKVGELEGM